MAVKRTPPIPRQVGPVRIEPFADTLVAVTIRAVGPPVAPGGHSGGRPHGLAQAGQRGLEFRLRPLAPLPDMRADDPRAAGVDALGILGRGPVRRVGRNLPNQAHQAALPDFRARAHVSRSRPALLIRQILARMRHDGCGGRAAKAELLTGVQGVSSRPVRRIVLLG